MEIFGAKTFSRIDGTRSTFFVFAKLELSKLLMSAFFRCRVPTMSIVAESLSVRECPSITFSYPGQNLQPLQLAMKYLPASMPEEHCFGGDTGGSTGGGPDGGGGWVEGGVGTQTPSFS